MIGETEPLNESPSEKEGKSENQNKKGRAGKTLNESPSEKEGKYPWANQVEALNSTLNESPSEKEGKWAGQVEAPNPITGIPQ